MSSHQSRRDPLPADYQFPTHGVDCDCQFCGAHRISDEQSGISIRFIKQYDIAQDVTISAIDVDLWGV